MLLSLLILCEHSQPSSLSWSSSPWKLWVLSRLILILFGDVVMGASSAHQTMRAPISERQVCCFVFFPLFSAMVSSENLFSHASPAAPTLLYLQLRLPAS